LPGIVSAIHLTSVYGVTVPAKNSFMKIHLDVMAETLKYPRTSSLGSVRENTLLGTDEGIISYRPPT
jgi:hypothetical protein